jgi:hypothetical protein
MSRIMMFLALASSVSPCIAQIRVDYAHGWDFSRYKTYRWVEAHETPSPDVQFPNQLMRERTVAFLEEVLAAKNLTRVETGGDLLVGYDLTVTALPQFTTFTDAGGPGWGWGGAGWASPGCCGWGGWGSGFSTTTVQTVLSGTLVVNMTDACQKRLVFQGVSTETISSRAEKNTKRLKKGIDEMFEKYPRK